MNAEQWTADGNGVGRGEVRTGWRADVICHGEDRHELARRVADALNDAATVEARDTQLADERLQHSAALIECTRSMEKLNAAVEASLRAQLADAYAVIQIIDRWLKNTLHADMVADIPEWTPGEVDAIRRARAVPEGEPRG